MSFALFATECMAAPDPYNLSEVIDACAKHAWARRESELRTHGFNSEAEVRAHVDKTVEGQDTRAFVCQPQEERGQVLQREVYNAPFDGPKSEKPYETTIVLNPNRDEHGQVYGGTCMVRGQEKKEFDRLKDDEADKIGLPPPVIEGGRPALREQQHHQQMANIEQPQQQPEKPQQPAPEKLTFFEDTPQPNQEHAHKIKF